MSQATEELNCRICTSSDLDALVEVSKETFVAAFEKDNNPKDFKEYVDRAFSKEQLLKELGIAETRFYFVFNGSKLVGYFKVNRGAAQSDIKDPNSLELERIYVVPGLQGKGIGAWILQKVIELAKEDQMEYVWLGVWEHNPKAIRFYQRFGFTKFGKHPYYIGMDEQTDWLLRLEL